MRYTFDSFLAMLQSIAEELTGIDTTCEEVTPDESILVDFDSIWADR